MARFIQLHLLTSYPPSNLNRDDLGRPKTARMGGKQRLRVSSQSLKRAWRTSDFFMETLAGNLGTRTKEIGQGVYRDLVEGGVKEKDAMAWAKSIAEVFGKPSSKKKDIKSLDIEQLAHFSPEELEGIKRLTATLIEEGRAPKAEELDLLSVNRGGVDIAMFGRMLAKNPRFNSDAAVQVAHALTVHEGVIEEDFFTAVDDLNKGEDDSGAGHVGEHELGAGLFYLYICIDAALLQTNLGGDEALAKRGITTLVEASAKVAPTGKQASYASRAYASYILAEVGDAQPRSLSVAFLKPLKASAQEDLLGKAISALESTRAKMDSVYGPCADDHKVMNAHNGNGTLKDILTLVGG